MSFTKPFARISFSERDNFITYFATNPLYINKIAFVEGNDSIPNQIWTNGKPYASFYNNSYNSSISEDDIRKIIKEYIDSNNNDVYDWEEYHDEESKPINIWANYE